MSKWVIHRQSSYDVHQLKVGQGDFVNYTYLLVDRKSQQAAIVDPAWDYTAIASVLQEVGARLVAILLTHSHHDHVNLVEPLVDIHHAQVYMTEEEILTYNFWSRNLCPLHDQDTLLLGGTPIVCLHTPGHTTGSACYLLPESLFTGDTVFTEGCGVCTMEGGNPEKMFASIQRLKATINPSVRFFPGHSFSQEPGRTLTHLLENNIYFQLKSKEHFVRFRMRKNSAKFMFQ